MPRSKDGSRSPMWRRSGERGRRRGEVRRLVTRFDLTAFRSMFAPPMADAVPKANGRTVRCACEGHTKLSPGRAFRVRIGRGGRTLLLCPLCAAYTVGVIGEAWFNSQFTTHSE